MKEPNPAEIRSAIENTMSEFSGKMDELKKSMGSRALEYAEKTMRDLQDQSDKTLPYFDKWPVDVSAVKMGLRKMIASLCDFLRGHGGNVAWELDDRKASLDAISELSDVLGVLEDGTRKYYEEAKSKKLADS